MPKLENSLKKAKKTSTHLTRQVFGLVQVLKWILGPLSSLKWKKDIIFLPKPNPPVFVIKVVGERVKSQAGTTSVAVFDRNLWDGSRNHSREWKWSASRYHIMVRSQQTGRWSFFLSIVASFSFFLFWQG